MPPVSIVFLSDLKTSLGRCSFILASVRNRPPGPISSSLGGVVTGGSVRLVHLLDGLNTTLIVRHGASWGDDESR